MKMTFARKALLSAAVSAALHQGDLNPITGDINFISLLLSRKKTVLTNLDVGVMDGKQGLRRVLLEWLWFRLPAKSARMITTISESAKRTFFSTSMCPKKEFG